ncbi:hypothetical protein ACRAWD_24590 [Caulobacter segnis]
MNFASAESENIRWGFNLFKAIGKAAPMDPFGGPGLGGPRPGGGMRTAAVVRAVLLPAAVVQAVAVRAAAVPAAASVVRPLE